MKINIAAILIFLTACNTNEKSTSDNKKEDVTKNDSIETPKVEKTIPEGFSIFENIEQIQYCVPVPQSLYKYDDITELERGRHLFIRPEDSTAYIEITGMFRSDAEVGIKEYFENSYTEDDEAEGKIIEEKKLNEKDSSFYAIGNWSNFPEKKFLEITWFGKEEIVVYYVSDFSVDHQPFWKRTIPFLTHWNPFLCK